ncbi:hypothetical protein A8B78_18325 [Jannaschia sp. EhC01]|nr:hypothetical protein A8B78_18325 [Jannaschia sp. EhC01]
MPSKRFFSRDLPLFDFLTAWPETAPVFFRHEMVCVGCLVGRFHTVTDACTAYGLDVDTFYAELAQALRSPRMRPIE